MSIHRKNEIYIYIHIYIYMVYLIQKMKWIGGRLEAWVTVIRILCVDVWNCQRTNLIKGLKKQKTTALTLLPSSTRATPKK